MGVSSRERVRKFAAARLAELRKQEQAITAGMAKFLQADTRVVTAKGRLQAAEEARGIALLKLVDELGVSPAEVAEASDTTEKNIRTMLRIARSAATAASTDSPKSAATPEAVEHGGDDTPYPQLDPSNTDDGTDQH